MALILVVDDDPDVRDLVRDVLEHDGYEVSAAADGAMAFVQLQQHHPDLVLLDLMMPVVDGWTFLEQCAAQPAACRVPVVIMSAIARQPGRPAIPSWVTHFLDKPFSLVDLLGVVRELTPAH